jgi:hypothetical protein
MQDIKLARAFECKTANMREIVKGNNFDAALPLRNSKETISAISLSPSPSTHRV